MNDAGIVSALAEGQLDGMTVLLERYANPLFDYCYRMAPDAAADAVIDTFIIGWEKLPELTDPRHLQRWLRAVAENECLRRIVDTGVRKSDAAPTPGTLPPEVPARVIAACADNTPSGRAYRVSAVYRAGPFGRDGFPKSRYRLARWRRRFPRSGRAVVAVAAVVAIATAIVIVAMPPSGRSSHDSASSAVPVKHTHASAPMSRAPRSSSPSSGSAVRHGSASHAAVPGAPDHRPPAPGTSVTPPSPAIQAPALAPALVMPPASAYGYANGNNGDDNNQGGNN
jgi:hypothetical protein